MTDEMMNLRAHKLREMITFAAKRPMEIKVGALTCPPRLARSGPVSRGRGPQRDAVR